MFYKLKKDLYGVKQAPRAWNEKIDAFFLCKGFHRSIAYRNLCIHLGNGLATVIVLYVDELIIIIIFTGGDTKHITQTKRSLASKFEMKDMGLLHFFLGLEIWQDQRGIFISQKPCVQELLQAFDM